MRRSGAASACGRSSTVETARLLGHDAAGALRAGCAVELLHCYSLVHDDLPSMDDDDLRRGRPDRSQGVRRGHGNPCRRRPADPGLRGPGRSRHRSRSRRSAPISCCGWRAPRASAAWWAARCSISRPRAATARRSRDQAGIRRLQAMKTGAILAFSVEAGAVVARAGAADLDATCAPTARPWAPRSRSPTTFSTGRPPRRAMGKRTGKDLQKGKATLVDLLGLDGSAPRMRPPRRARPMRPSRRSATRRRPCGRRSGSWSSARPSRPSAPRTAASRGRDGPDAAPAPSGMPAIGADDLPGGLVVVVAGEQDAGEAFGAGNGQDPAQASVA